MATHRLQQFFRLASGRTGVAARHDGSELVPTLLVSLDAAAEIESGLRRIEMRVIAHCVRMPDVDHGVRNRFARDGAYLPFHEQHLAIVGTIIESRSALRDLSSSDVHRTLDSAHGAA